MSDSRMPSGMIEVTKDQFFAALEADKRDIMPSVRNEYFTVWETKNRQLWGWNSHGWKIKTHIEPAEIYAIYPAAIKQA